MKKKSYKITFELREGYAENANEHSPLFAENVIKAWMEDRLIGGRPVLSGLLQEGTLLYPSVSDEKKVTAARCLVFTGELSSPKDVQRKNKEIQRTLEALAETIKEALHQKSVFITYRDKHWCI